MEAKGCGFLSIAATTLLSQAAKISIGWFCEHAMLLTSGRISRIVPDRVELQIKVNLFAEILVRVALKYQTAISSLDS